MRRGQALSQKTRIAVGMALVIFAVPSILTRPASADDYMLTRATLKGIAAVQVLVEEIDPDAERDGLTRDQLQADVALRLGEAGVPVRSSAMEALYVNVNTYKGDTGVYAFAVAVELKQVVRLARDSKIAVFSPTWSVGSVGMAGASSLRRAVHANVANHVDEFIKAYLEQNPKP